MHLFLLGAGHVGLVTAVGFVRLGHRVTVADLDEARITDLNQGRPPVFEPGLTESLADGLASGWLVFTTRLNPPPDAPFTFVCVSTPTDADGPLSTVNVEIVVGRLLADAGTGHVIVVRSTLPLDGPGRLAAVAAAAGRADRPSIVTNPEFMREGQALEDFDRPNRVVTGWLEPRDQAAAQAVIDLYAPLGAPSMVADARSVALIKLGSNVFLGTKISFANEMARVADATGADIEAVIAGIGLDPRIGLAFLKPGPGIGGSCLPEQAIAIALQTAALDVEAPLLSAVHRSIAVHEHEIVRRLETLLGGPGSLAGRRIAQLGLAFKADTDDVRESPALALAANLRAAGADVITHDPRAERRAHLADPTLVVASTAMEALRDAEAIIVVTEWAEYGAIDWAAAAAAMPATLIYDTRGIVDVEAARRAGLRVERLGRPGAGQSVAGLGGAGMPAVAGAAGSDA
ncbi:MAG: UDP-glucose/GDP-mannose dehydrogenase family protein [Chloroflexi bacterium]|nr:UDP-glucose/GDP-mannose dehydrogenase family protein [Chloroflexota bacterium]